MTKPFSHIDDDLVIDLFKQDKIVEAAELLGEYKAFASQEKTFEQECAMRVKNTYVLKNGWLVHATWLTVSIPRDAIWLAGRTKTSLEEVEVVFPRNRRMDPNERHFQSNDMDFYRGD